MNTTNQNYYRGNLLLDYLSANQLFFVPANGTWIILYADTNDNALLMLRVYDNQNLFETKRISTRWFEDIPFGEIVIKESNSFAIRWQFQQKFQMVTQDELYLEFQKRNLVLSKSYLGKPFNSKASSRYHIWQSQNKFVGGITDIDLLRLDAVGNPIEIIEIKRSRISPEIWKPYFQDRGGYEILEKFCEKFSLEFSIIYYHFDPKNRIEDIQNLTLFRKKKGFNFERVGLKTLDDFLCKKY